jgi:glutaredoxin
MLKATFYHAGCPVCVNALDNLVCLIDQSRCDLEVVDFARDKTRINEAEDAGVKSVPAIVIGGNALHINFGASIEDLKS